MEKRKTFLTGAEYTLLRKMLRIMKLTTFLILLTSLMVSASVYSQNTRLSLQFEKIHFSELFREIEEQTEFRFAYSNSKLDPNQEILIDVKDETLEAILNKVLPEGITYEIVDRYVVILDANERNTVVAKQQQQQRVVSGRVTDPDGLPFPGVTVVIKGTTQGTITSNGGDYSLANVPENATLVFSFVGMKSQEINVGTQTRINVQLQPETIGIEEVVAIGYGTVRKSDLTGSVASVTSESIKDKPVVSAAEAIAGQIAGVQIQQLSGMPGAEGLSIRVRGTGSITQSNEPLYVIDGYPMEGNAFRMISPSNIESIEVLKDASSTAIYGSRGANGVIIITTKKGAGTPSISFNMYAGVQQPEKYFDMMNRDEFIDYFIDGRNQAWLDAGIVKADPDKSPHKADDPNSRRKLYPNSATLYEIPDGQGGYTYNFLDPASVAQMPDNDWQRLLFRNAIMQKYELTLSGGSSNTQYLFSAGYIQQEGIVLNSDFDRINLNANINSKVNEKLRVGINMSSYFSTANEQVEGKYSPIQIALQLPPIFPVTNEDGTYGSMVRNYDIFPGDVASPIGMAEQITTLRKRYGWLAILFADWEIVNDLHYKISLNGGVQDNNRNYYLPSYVDMDASRAPRMAEATNEKQTDKDWVLEQTLTYQKTFAGKHAVTALAGYTTQKHFYDRLFGEARGFPNDKIKTINAGNMYDLTGTESEYSMISYLARLNYTYDNKYLFAAAFRSDGSSRFGKNNKWGSFPSISAGWRIKQENFMKGVDLIDDLKLRASYGIAGNNRIGNYSAIGLLNIGYYPTGDALQNTVNPNTMPNDDLGWEKTEQINLGFDLSLLNNRFRLEGDFYNSESLELLLNVPVPTITGYTSQMQNVGKVQNKGMEFLVSTKNLINVFKWSTSFNISFNKNEVLEVGPDGRPIFASAPNASNAFITQIGSPIASFYGYVYEGVFMSQEELDKYPHLSQDKVGDGRYRDINGDKKMDAKDMTILGDNHPLFTGGLANNFEYKNFNLGVQLTGSYGAEVFSIYKRMIAVYHGDRNAMVEVLDRWNSPDDPGNGQIFRPTRTPTGWSRSPSSLWLTDGSYLRIRNVTLSYNFDSAVVNKLAMKGLRVYLTGQNLYTFTKNPGYDPEASSEGGGLTKGGDYTGYPSARAFIFGVNVTF